MGLHLCKDGSGRVTNPLPIGSYLTIALSPILDRNSIILVNSVVLKIKISLNLLSVSISVPHVSSEDYIYGTVLYLTIVAPDIYISPPCHEELLVYMCYQESN